MTTEAPLPAILCEISEIVGHDAAMAIAKAVGGTRTYFPARPTSKSWISKTIGQELATKLCAHFADRLCGQFLDIPLLGNSVTNLLRKKIAVRIRELDEAGLSVRQIVRKVGISERTVRRHLAAHRESPR